MPRQFLKRIVKDQLVSFISGNQLLSVKQHGFVNGRSTTINILSCDTLIADIESIMAAYDIIEFEFRKAFDKVPHYKLLETLSSFHVDCNPLA